MSLQLLSILVTIAIALAGFGVTYLNQLRLARRREYLDLVNLRLNEFYGPLYVSSNASAIAFDALRRKLGRDHVFADRSHPDEPALREWKIWLTEVLMPLNEFREDLILRKSYLIREREMPDCLLRFVAHAAAYKAVLKKWKDGDFSEVLSIIDFPAELDVYASRSYGELKREQMALIRGAPNKPLERAGEGASHRGRGPQSAGHSAPGR
jgi:hypothetical protein